MASFILCEFYFIVFIAKKVNVPIKSIMMAVTRKRNRFSVMKMSVTTGVLLSRGKFGDIFKG